MKSILSQSIFRLALISVVFIAPLRAAEVASQQGLQLAATAPTGGRADWQQWDAFLTFITKRFGHDLTGNLRDDLIDVFLDARYDLVRALVPSEGASSDVVPGLFLSTMTRLSPLLRQGALGLPSSSANQFSNFAVAVDKFTFLGGIGLQLGFVTITPDMLRGLARIAEPSLAVDPVDYQTDFDLDLRELVGFGLPLPSPKPSPLLEQSRLRGPPAPSGQSRRVSTRSWFMTVAVNAEPENNKLNQWVPDRQELNAYLTEVRELLNRLGNETLTRIKLASEFHTLYQNLVFATAWQESCWRQFIRKGEKVAPLSSLTGDVGLMQVNQRVWRGVYDIKGLVGDIEYNTRAGTEILLNYLSKYAIRKGEHKQAGGVSNLARASYGAYNGGPRHLTRYRAPKPNPALKKVDDAFWQKYSAVSSGREMDVLQCYGQ
jgi:hypothetical protein